MPNSWSVVATLAEPEPVTLGFAAFYLETDAGEISIYLDTPGPGAEALAATLGAHPRITVQICDADYWQSVGGRPAYTQDRQKVNANRSYGRCRSQWLLHCDADEFLINADRVSRRLETRDEVDFLRVPVAERLYLPGEAAPMIYSSNFRRPTPVKDIDFITATYGDFAPFLESNTTGHAVGKSFVRCGRDIPMRLHTPNDKAQGNFTGDTMNGVHLAHFDGFSERSFSLKLLRQLANREDKPGPYHEALLKYARAISRTRRTPPPPPGLNAQREELRKLPADRASRQHASVHSQRIQKRLDQKAFIQRYNGDPAALTALHDGIKRIDATQRAALEARKLLVSHDLDIPGCAARQFPDRDLAFDTSSYDRAFAKELLARYGNWKDRLRLRSWLS